jgi:predicted nucleotidyltransferase
MQVKLDYRKILGSLTSQLFSEIGDRIHAVVLFGSVVRQEANRDSDIDLLIVADLDFSSRQKIHDISYEIDLENEVFTQVMFYTPEGFEKRPHRSLFLSRMCWNKVSCYMTTEPIAEFVRRSLSLSQEFLDDSKALLEQSRLRSAIDRA